MAVLLVVDLVRGLPHALAVATDMIWGIFIFDLTVRFLVAPRKLLYLRRNLLTILSLALPAFRLLRFARALRFVRGVSLVQERAEAVCGNSWCQPGLIRDVSLPRGWASLYPSPATKQQLADRRV